MFTLQLSAFCAFFLLSMGFSAAESALTALSTLRMKRMSSLKPELRPVLTEWLVHPHRLLSTILVGNNFVNVAASSLFYAMTLPLSAWVPERLLSVLLWLAATVLLVAGGEVLPKIVGRTYREQVGTFCLPPLARLKNALFFVWGPVGWLLSKTSPRLAQAPANPLMVTNLEELHLALTETESQGGVPRDAVEMMRRVFHLTEKSAAQIMTPAERVDGLSLDLLGGRRAPDFYVDVLIESGHTRVPVFGKGALVGYVNVMDLADLREPPPVERLIRPLRRVAPDVKAPDLLALFKSTGDPIAAVQDGERFLGLVTMEDVLEEIVGEILDEYDAERRK